ncbi:MAG: hypothetical protein IID50_07710 [Proteobacteria bacterium]|nr:hypothetical protein [Pseudomonadota bacterium]
MATSGLRGPFPLTKDGIDNNVTGTSAGAYALGATKDNTFYISYVGRSDADVADRLKDHISAYKQFKYEFYDSAKAAFEKEGHLYHDFKPGGNVNHPARPSGTFWKCPRCTIFD